MTDLKTMSHEEKVFLAGCIKTVIMAHGDIEAPELEDLERIYRRLDFHDYEQCLSEFEREIPDREAFYAAAKKIDNPAAQDVILSVAYELSMQSGIPDGPQQENIVENLSKLWRQG
jgi:hypothetical protein